MRAPTPALIRCLGSPVVPERPALLSSALLPTALLRPARVALVVLVGLLALLVGPTGPVGAATVPARGSTATGSDISWPNCPLGMGIAQRPTLNKPMPIRSANFVIMGLTNGPAFSPNPCLASQVRWVTARHLWGGAYSIVSYPNSAELAKYGGAGTLQQRLTRVGRTQAARNIAVMRKAGLRAPMVWVDVEPVKGWPWSADVAANNTLIDGVLAGYRAAGVRTGLYSYAYGWKQITGGRQLPTVPIWATSGKNSAAAAAARCTTGRFSGGPVWLAQWSDGERDYNLTCPGVTGTPGGAKRAAGVMRSMFVPT